jgi:hypothetical protein
MLLGAVGCVGAWFEKKYLLFAVNINPFSCFSFYRIFKYIITMVIIFVALLFGVVFVIAFNEQVKIIGFVMKEVYERFDLR